MEGYEKRHLKRLRKYLAECTVLLKSDGSFPLPAPAGIALYGNGAEFTVRGGTGSGEVNSRFFINAERGLAGLGFTVTTGKWMDRYLEIRADAERAFRRKLLLEAAGKRRNPVAVAMGRVMPEPEYAIPLDTACDVPEEAAVYVLSRISGEGSDRKARKGDFFLTDTEVRDILALNTRFQRFMLVLNVTGPVDLSPVMEVGNILLLSQLGTDTGRILGRILLGKDNPSGKLAATWPRFRDMCRAGDFGDPDDTHYREGIYVGYRYYSTAGVKPLFPFGFGLSYTRFSCGEAKCSMDGETVTMKVPVRNDGRYAGKETLQAYVTKPVRKLDQPYLALAGWCRTPLLAPGETAEAVISFAVSSLASYEESSARWLLEPGDYIIRVGTSSETHVPAAVVRIEEEISTAMTVNRCGIPGFADRKMPQDVRKNEVLPPGLPVLRPEPGAVPCRDLRDFGGDGPSRILPEAAGMTEEELAAMNLGLYSKGNRLSQALSGVIGGEASSVPGAAGETRPFEGRTLVMADGPAGLRLQKKYAEDGGGKHALGPTMPESMLAVFPKWVTDALSGLSYRPGPDAEMREQYCTALPIGTALAQSWNTEFAEICGDIVGEEMERFGVHLWLAPGMNLQRSVFCGRNFEYYSEDPLVSGRFAAAVTRGVQAHRHCGVTIKHFCANNQETNRMNSNSLVSERALRELYLRGFEICIKEAAPRAVMTSYNLLNGVHTSENRELSEGILRKEFGHRGILMTDWIVDSMPDRHSLHENPDPAKIAAAGCELVMPGSEKHYRRILRALREGTLDRAQLEENVSRLIEMIRELGTETQDPE